MTLTEEIEEAAEAEAVEAKAEVAEEASLEAEVTETKVLMLTKTLSQLFESSDNPKVNINNQRASTQNPSHKEYSLSLNHYSLSWQYLVQMRT